MIKVTKKDLERGSVHMLKGEEQEERANGEGRKEEEKNMENDEVE